MFKRLLAAFRSGATRAIEDPNEVQPEDIRVLELADILARLRGDDIDKCPGCDGPTSAPGRLCWYCDDEPDDEDDTANFEFDFGGEG